MCSRFSLVAANDDLPSSLAEEAFQGSVELWPDEDETVPASLYSWRSLFPEPRRVSGVLVRDDQYGTHQG